MTTDRHPGKGRWILKGVFTALTIYIIALGAHLVVTGRIPIPGLGRDAEPAASSGNISSAPARGPGEDSIRYRGEPIPLKKRPAREEHKIYSWIDKNGTRAFSNVAPREQVTDLKISDAYVPDSRPAAGRSRFTPITFQNNRIHVPARLGYRSDMTTARLLLDTGATTTVLHRNFARRLGLRTGRPGTVRLGDGRTVAVQTAVLDYLDIGPHRVKDLEVFILDHHGSPAEEEGVLGMNFLKHFQYQLDLKNKRIVWQDATASLR